MGFVPNWPSISANSSNFLNVWPLSLLKCSGFVKVARNPWLSRRSHALMVSINTEDVAKSEAKTVFHAQSEMFIETFG